MVGNLGNLIPAAFVGPGGQRLTEDQIRARQAIALSLARQATDTSPNAGGWASILAKGVEGIASNAQENRAANAYKANLAADSQGVRDTLNAVYGGDGAAYTSAGTTDGATLPTPGAQGEIAAVEAPKDLTDSKVFNGFLEPIKGVVTNPFGLAAIAATGRQESGYSPANVYRTWNDPSTSGAPGTSGGIMSWRGPRYDALKATGDLSPQGQGKYFIQENQDIIPALNNAKTLEEAQSIMDKKWGFGDNSGPRRLAYAKGFLPSFQGGGQVASAGPQNATEAIAAQTGGQAPYVDPQVTTAYAAQPQNVPVPTPRPDVASLLASPQPIPLQSPQLTPEAIQASVAQPPQQPMQDIGPLAPGPRVAQEPAPLSDQNFNDRFGSGGPAETPIPAQSSDPAQTASIVPQAPQAAPSPFDAITPGQQGAAAPQVAQAAPPLAAPVDVPSQTISSPAPAQPQFAMPAPRLMPVPAINPAIVNALSDPNAGPQSRAVANALLGQAVTKRNQAIEYNQKAMASQQELQQRVNTAKNLGIDPNLALDEDAWKAAVTENISPHMNVVDGQLVSPKGNVAFGKPTLPTSAQEFEYGQAHPGFTAEQERLKKAGSQSITVGGGSGTQIFETMNKSADLAQGAATGLNAIREARKAVAGGIVSGAGADQRLGLQKIGSFLGVTDPSEITNTETFRAAIAPQISAVLHATAGTANLSDADREFATKAAGGSINLDATSINKILTIMEKAGTNSIKLHNSKVDKVYPEGQGFERERALFRIDEPTADAPAPPLADGPAQIQSKEQFDALPSGTTFIAPDGTVRTKP